MTPQCILSVAISNYPKDEKHSFKSCWVFLRKKKRKLQLLFLELHKLNVFAYITVSGIYQ